MKKTSSILLLFVSVLATTPAPAQQGAATKTPRAMLTTNLVEIGTVKANEIRKTEFIISNAGESPLQITDILATCGCISGAANKKTLQPKEEGVITVRLDANLVHGTFSRSVWVETNDPKNPRLILSVKGDSVPLFHGLPPMPVVLRASNTAVAWTNQFTLTASETNLFLGTPTIRGRDYVQIDVTVVTNAAETMSYTITVVLKPIEPSLHVATVTFPVIGNTGTKHRPIKMQFQTNVGTELFVTPNRILLNPDGNTSPQRLIVKTTEPNANTNLLSWSPAVEGVNISFLPQNSPSTIALILNVSNEASKRLLKENIELKFDYPNHKPAKLPFSTIIKTNETGS